MAIDAAMAASASRRRRWTALLRQHQRAVREKQMASVLATACDLPRAIFTADFAGSRAAA
jgi:hypothetical protein